MSVVPERKSAVQPSRANGGWPIPRPFLKWVGGKNQLLPELMKRLDKAGEFGRYHEPFVGGGALFFELYRNNRLGKKQAYLSDNNAPLIEAYRGVQDDVEGVIAALEKHKAQHGEEYFYEVRAKLPKKPAERAARIIYLNKTCYNGLYRENSKGQFNTPFGRYKNPQICDEPNLRAVADALKKAKLEVRNFTEVVDAAKPGDLVYFDPPYHPVSKTANFTGYDRNGFNELCQRQLANVFRQLTEKDVKALLSNSYCDFIIDLYADIAHIDEVQAARAVNSRADRRGKVPEALICNF